MWRFAIVLAAISLGLPALPGGGETRAETVLRINTGALGTLDPAKASAYVDLILMVNAYDTLVLPAAGAPGHVPHLAKSWTKQDNSYTFDLRDDVRFQSGNTLSADDVVFSFERMRALDGSLAYLFEPVEAVTAVASHTVRFDLKTPYAAFLPALLRLPIVDKDLVMDHLGGGSGQMKDWGRDYLSSNAAGTGAYRVVAHAEGSGTTLAKNANYFLDLPKSAPDRVEITHGLQPEEVEKRIRDKQLDISSQWLPPEVLGSLAKDGASLLTEPGAGGFYLKMNTRKPPLDDPECRLAVANAFDYAAALKLLRVNDGTVLGTAASGAIPAGMLGAYPPSQALKQDMSAAKRHLGACRYAPADIELDIVWIEEVPLERQFAELLKKNAADLGLKSVIGAMTWESFVSGVDDPSTTPGISMVYDFSATGDVDALLYGMYHSGVQSGFQSAEHLDDRQVDALLDKGRAATSNHDRATAYRDLNARLLAIAPTIYAYDRISVFAAGDRVKVPALSDPASRFEVPAMGFSFRLMEMTEHHRSK